MNILFINSARTWGGTEKWTSMAAGVMAPEHRALLVYRKNIVGDRFDVPKFRLPCFSHIDMYTIMQVVRIVRREAIDVIIPTKRKDYMIAGLAARICDVANVLRLGIVRTPSRMWLHRLMYRSLADGIIVNAVRIRENLLKAPYMSKSRIKVIYNGLDTDEIDRKIPADLPRKYQGFLIASMGILTKRKGFDFLIRSFAQFMKKEGIPDARLLIIGSGPESANLQGLCRELGIADRVSFTGFLDNPYPLLAQSDVFAMVSRNEGISNALLEAMYLGNTAVSTRAGGADEAIEEGVNGYLVDYGDEEKLATVLLELYRSPELRRQLSRQACESVIRQFSMNRMKSDIIAFCHECIRLKNTPETP
jgi:glycosyltransferase involved in cell wall biosynthesis